MQHRVDALDVPLEVAVRRIHVLPSSLSSCDACTRFAARGGGVSQRGAREHRLGVARPGRRGQLGGAEHPTRRRPEAAAAPAAEPPLRPVGVAAPPDGAGAPASGARLRRRSSPSISSRSSGRIALTIAPYPNLSSTPPPIARLLTIRGYGPVGTEDAISGLTQPYAENNPSSSGFIKQDP